MASLTNKQGSTRASSSSKKSSSSKNSRMTHKSKRRHDRKKTSLRQGGMFEEAALFEALATIVDRAAKAKLVVPKLVDALLYLGLRPQAAEVEQTLAKLLQTIAAKYTTVWTPDSLGFGPVGVGGVEGGSGAGPGMFGANATANSRAERFLAGGGIGGGLGGGLGGGFGGGGGIGEDGSGGGGGGLREGTTVSSITVSEIVVAIPPKPVPLPDGVSRPDWRHRFVDFKMC
jgi:hypothetical protein